MRGLSTLLVSSGQGNIFLVGESWRVVPLLTTATSALWRPSHAGTGMFHMQAVPDSEVWKIATTRV